MHQIKPSNRTPCPGDIKHHISFLLLLINSFSCVLQDALSFVLIASGKRLKKCTQYFLKEKGMGFFSCLVSNNLNKQIFIQFRIPSTPINFKFVKSFYSLITKLYLSQHAFSHGQLYVELPIGISTSITRVLLEQSNRNE